MLDFLSKQEHNAKPLMFHGFSVGGIVYTTTVLQILRNPEKYGKYITDND